MMMMTTILVISYHAYCHVTTKFTAPNRFLVLESDRRGAEGGSEGDEMVFDQESFASKMRQFLFPDLGWLGLEMIAECMAGRLLVETWQTGWLANFSLTRLWKIKGRRML